MLVLSRKPGETIHIGPVAVSVCRIEPNRVRLGIDAPQFLRVVRGELLKHERPVPPPTLEELVAISCRPNIRQEPELMFAALASAISMLAEEEYEARK